MDLGGTNIRTVVADAAADPVIIGSDRRATPRPGLPQWPEAADLIVAAIAESVRAALAAASTDLVDIAAVSCAAPGPLDHQRGVVHSAPNLEGFRDYPLAERLSGALDGTTVFVDRDTAIAAIGERLAGAARGVEDFVYVTVSTGVGGAIVSGGRMLRGTARTAGEIGHFPVALDGPRCGCGSYGCVESLASGRDVAEQYGVDDAEEVFVAAQRGDERASALVARLEHALGSLAVGLTNAIDPALIVVGGAIAEHQPHHVFEPMRRHIAERAFATPAAAVRVVPAELGANVGTIGAVLAARERIAGRAGWFL